mmetsp:Transcript_89290/g.257551  ORF Transcript_89290/g.257551 Transcript_89290/m.257551 type:complete len:294 (-) Transcript_89290:618-1499(-)
MGIQRWRCAHRAPPCEVLRDLQPSLGGDECHLAYLPDERQEVKEDQSAEVHCRLQGVVLDVGDVRVHHLLERAAWRDAGVGGWQRPETDHRRRGDAVWVAELLHADRPPRDRARQGVIAGSNPHRLRCLPVIVRGCQEVCHEGWLPSKGVERVGRPRLREHRGRVLRLRADADRAEPQRHRVWVRGEVAVRRKYHRRVCGGIDHAGLQRILVPCSEVRVELHHREWGVAPPRVLRGQDLAAVGPRPKLQLEKPDGVRSLDRRLCVHIDSRRLRRHGYRGGGVLDLDLIPGGQP